MACASLTPPMPSRQTLRPPEHHSATWTRIRSALARCDLAAIGQTDRSAGRLGDGSNRGSEIDAGHMRGSCSGRHQAAII